MRKLLFTVTNDLTYDQRMHRICTTLAGAGYAVTLIGRELKSSRPLGHQPFQQKRLRCFFNKGFLFYAEYNLRLFAYLVGQKADCVCAIDLDTILPVLFASKLKSSKRAYDAHEYFTELKEVITRPMVKRFWTSVEGFALPYFPQGYTVSEGLAEKFAEKFKCNYKVIRNLPVLQTIIPRQPIENVLIYQGAVNEGRGFEYLVPALKKLPCRLVVCGDGNFMDKLQELISAEGVQNQVELKGMLLPKELRETAALATLGIGLAEREGINQFHALPNKFLEYIHAGLPQIAMDFPEYRKINNEFEVAVLTEDLNPEALAETIQQTMNDKALLNKMEAEALKAREVYCWQAEETKLIAFYNQLFE